MKKHFRAKQIGRFISGAVLGILLSVLFVSVINGQSNNDGTVRIADATKNLTIGGKNPEGQITAIDKFRLGPKKTTYDPETNTAASESDQSNHNYSTLNDKIFNTNNDSQEPGDEALFYVIGSTIIDRLVAFYPARFTDRLYVGFSEVQTPAPEDPKLQVDGAITIKAFADPTRTTPERLCVNDIGSLAVCAGTIDTSLITSQPGSCAEFTGEHVNQPATNDNDGCLVGTFNEIDDEGESDLTWDWQCIGVDGGVTAECSVDKLIELDDIGIGGSSASAGPSRFFAWLTGAKVAEASSSICSERNNLNDNGIYKRTDTIYVRYGDELPLLVDDGSGNRKVVDYSQLESGAVSNGTIRIYDGINLSSSSLLPDGEYIISGDSVVNENRDPLQNPDGFNIRFGTPVSAVSLVVNSGSYVFETCGEEKTISNDQIRALDIGAIQQKLEEYYQQNGQYPDSGGATIHNSSWSNSANTSSWNALGAALGVNLPVDPTNNAEVSGTNVNTSTNYQYHYYSRDNAFGCGDNQWYMLVYNPEDVATPSSPGAEACSQNFNYSGTITVGNCKDPACDASWEVTPASWNDVQCDPQTGTKTRTVQCKGTDGLPTAETNCWEQSKPEEQINCTVNAICKVHTGSTDAQPAIDTDTGCLAGTYTDNTDVSNQWRWQCQGLNGGSAVDCTSTRTTYSWQTGFWSACNQTNGIQTRDVICHSSTGFDVEDSKCTTTKPATQQNCGVDGACKAIPGSFETNPATSTSVACQTGTLQNTGSTANTWTWQCAGLNDGQTVSCSAMRKTFAWVITIPNPENPNNPDGWGVCPEETHTQTREVRCKASTGEFVVDSKCTTTKPATSQACLTNDEIRELDIAFIKQKLEDYYQANGSYPSTSGAIEPSGGWANSSHGSWSTLETVLGLGSGVLPVDPINTPENNEGNWSNEYRYHYYGGGGYGCQSGQWYMLVYNPELVLNPSSPGAEACSQDFQYNGTVTTGDCKDPACNSTWQTSIWGSCQNDGYQYRNVSCVDALGQSTAETNCWEQSKPASQQFCGLLHLNAVNDTAPFDNNTGLSVIQDATNPSNATDGADVFEITGNRYLVTNGIFAVDPSNIYTLSGNFKSTGSGDSRVMLGMLPYDENMNYLGITTASNNGSHNNKSLNFKSNAAEAIIESFDATTITTNGLADLSLWRQNDANTDNMSIGFYYDGDISKAPDAVMYRDGYTTASGNTINLSEPIDTAVSSNIIPGVTAIRNHSWSGDIRPATQSNTYVPNTWNTYSGSTTKEQFNMGNNVFPYGTRYVRVVVRANYAQANTYVVNMDDIKLYKSGAQPVINGSCQSFTGDYANKPYSGSSTACSNGSTLLELTSAPNEWRWKCLGYSGGVDASCTAKRVLNGVCGTTHTNTYLSQPTLNCKWGTPNIIDGDGDDGEYNWECVGENTGTTASCYANRVLDGVCQSYTSQYGYTSQPGTNDADSCLVGTLEDLADGPGVWNWRCNGLHGGNPVDCSATRVVYTWSAGSWGSCDAFAGTRTRSVVCNATPTQQTGNPVDDSLCDAGSRPADTENCLVNGLCKNYPSTDGYLTQPATNTNNACNAGAYNNATPTDTADTWYWTCDGLNEGSGATCSAAVRADGVCGANDGGTFTVRPENNCAVGVPSWTDGTGTDGEWNWTCAGYGAGTTANCAANYQRDAVCAVHSGAYDDEPATDLASGCAVGSAFTDLTDTSTLFRWRCEGWHGGTPIDCSATRYVYDWNITDWGACNPHTGIQNRTVTCVASPTPPGGNPVLDAKCSGTKPATQQNCDVNPICKAYTGPGYITEPATNTTNGCDAGTFSQLADDVDTFNWRCNAINNGTPASVNCSANWRRDAVCKTYSSEQASQPATNDTTGCTLGTFTNTSNTAHTWRWQCNGYNGGANQTCTAPVTYSWQYADWSTISCPTSTAMKTRTVTCVSSTGSTVADSYCSGTKPALEEFCGIMYYNATNNANPFGIGDLSVVQDSSTPSNAAWGADVYQIVDYRGAIASDFISVDSSNTYRLSGNFKSTGSGGNSLLYFGLATYDVNYSLIGYHRARKPDSVDAKVLSVTDTTIVIDDIADLSTWYQNAAHNSSIGIYYDGDISKLPDYVQTYAYSTAAGNTINLNSALPAGVVSQIIPGTTVVKNHTWYNYNYNPVAGLTVPNTWTNYSGDFSKEAFINDYTIFPPDVKYVKIMALFNYGQDANYSLYVDDIKFWEVAQSTINGSCKPITGNHGTKPAISDATGCNSGTWLERTSTDTEWRWICKGYGGGTDANCSANRVSAGKCKVYSSNYNSQPGTNTTNGCERGTWSEVADGATTYNWRCTGANGGTVDNCSANKIVNGICNTSYTGDYASQQATNDATGCVSGFYQQEANTADNYNWSCQGANTGTSQNCSHKRQMPGGCIGGLTNPTYASQPGTNASNGCIAYNTWSQVSNTQTQWRWSCQGYNNGTTASCSVLRTPNCGSFNDNYTTQPANSSNGCTAGTYGDTSDTTSSFVWECSNGGETVTCNANRVVAAGCGSFPNAGYTSQPANSGNGCAANNSYTDATDTTTEWKWSCTGDNGGNTVSCSAPRVANAVCVSYGSTGYPSQQATNNATGCTVGNYVNLTNVNDTYNWLCEGINTGSDANCSHKQKITPACVNFANATYSSQPGTTSANACASYNTYADAGDTQTLWQWSCTGNNGGDSISCAEYKTPICQSHLSSYTQPATNNSTACTAGTYQDTADGSTTFNWNCINNGVTQACSSPKAIDGVCKPYANATYSSQPGTNTSTGCNAGTFAEVADTTNEWKWQCSGINSGSSSVTCTEYKVPECKTYGASYTNPATNTATGCTIGTFSNATDGVSTFNWTCSNNGTNIACSSPKNVNGACNTSYTGNYATQPATSTANGCTAGYYGDQGNNTHQWRWICNGYNNGTDQICAASPDYYWVEGGFGSCNSANGMQTQTVVCKSRIGNVTVADTYCSSAKPPTEQFCGLLNLNANDNPTPFDSNGSVSVVSDPSVPSNSIEQGKGPNVYRVTSNYPGFTSATLVNVDPDKIYTVAGNFKSTGASNSIIYFGLVPYTSSSSFISHQDAYRKPNADDAIIQSFTSSSITTDNIADLATWWQAGSAVHVRSIAFYYDGDISKRPDYVFYSDKYSSISGNTINLTTAIPASVSSQIIPGTTAITNNQGGGTYLYTAASYSSVPNTWTDFSATISLEQFTSGNNVFRPETRKVKLLLLANYQGASQDLYFNDLRIWQSGTQPSTNGSCKSLPSSYASKPYADNNSATGCNAGVLIARTSTASEWLWKCEGYGGGTDVLCSASRGTDGLCNTSYTGNYSSQPATNTSNGCLVGNYADAADGATTYNWTCSGYNSGAPDSCSANKIVAASCKSYGSTGYGSQQATNAATGCTAGNYVDVTDENDTYNWRCNNINTSGYVNCSHKKQMPGICASFNTSSGTTYSSQPATNSSNGCGAYNAYSGNTNTQTLWRWYCDGNNNGTRANCSVPRQPVCYVHGQSYTQPATNTASGCTAGTYQDTGDGSTTFNWNCTNNGVTQACSSPKAVNGVCTDAPNATYTYQPGACTAGTFTEMSDTSNTWNWRCSGINGGTNDDCTEYKPPVCNTSYTGNYSSQPATNTSNGCIAGTYSDLSDGATTYDWRCSNNGVNVSCDAKKITPGQCVSYGSSYGSQPATNTSNGCTIGTFQENSDISTKWQWSCNGVNGGNPTLCQADPTYSWQTGSWGACNSTTGIQTRSVWCQSATGGTVGDGYCGGGKPATSQTCPVSGQCQSHTGNYTSQPATNDDSGCLVGSYANASNTVDHYRWTCSGLNGGSTVTCEANWQRAGQCQSHTGNYTSQPATSTATGCTVGTYANATNTSDHYRWTCSGVNGGSTTTCEANWQRNGICTSYGGSYGSQPGTSTANGCDLGTYSNVSNTSTAWRWSCSGVNGGSATTCNANPTYSWQTGAWGSCSGGTETRSVWCQSATGGTVGDGYCGGGKPATSQICWALVADYRFDLCKDGYYPSDTAIDSSGNGHHTTNSSFMTINSGTKIGNSVDYDGDSQYQGTWPNLTINPSSTYGFYLPESQKQTNSFTISGWYWPDNSGTVPTQSNSGTAGTSGQHYALEPKNYAGAAAGMGLSVNTNFVAVFEHSSSYLPALAVATDSTLGNGWHHIVVVYDNRQPKIYINGSLVATGVTSAKTTVYSPTRIGHGYYGVYNGDIDEVKIYSGAMSSSDVLSLYNSEVSATRSCSV